MVLDGVPIRRAKGHDQAVHAKGAARTLMSYPEQERGRRELRLVVVGREALVELHGRRVDSYYEAAPEVGASALAS